MTEQTRENYFLVLKTIMILTCLIYLLLRHFETAGASYHMLLLSALYLGLFIINEFFKTKIKILFCTLLIAESVFFIFNYGLSFIFTGILSAYETISCIKVWHENRKQGMLWYILPLFLPVLFYGEDFFIYEMFAILTGIIYIQHDFIIDSYKKQLKDSVLFEMHLKKDIHRQENALREELRQGLLLSENHALEEREELFQTLHDKLGHTINGSVYQLEAVKVLLKNGSDVNKSLSMLQAVIDQLRTGMDEIRAILRKQRPKKYTLAILQLKRLCEECEKMNIKASLITKGDLSHVPENYLEIVLDNAFEAVSNSLKYAHCTKIDITLISMNEMLRCSIWDNGVGCSKITDGMGIAGMRKRIRSVNGILDFSGEAGFTINMLMPY